MGKGEGEKRTSERELINEERLYRRERYNK